jgi:hypothetical protein
MIHLDMKLIRYRGGEDSDYVYFWTVNENGMEVHASPMFICEEDAIRWINNFNNEVDKCMSKLGRT